MQDDDHLPVARLEDGVFDVVVKNVHFVAADRREAETWREVYWLVELLMCPGGADFFPPTVGVRLQGALHPLLRDVGSDVKVFELGVAAVQVDDQRVLLDDALLFLLLRLPGLVALLHLFDDAEGVLQVGRGDRCVAGGLQVGRSIRAGQKQRVPKLAAAEAEETPHPLPPRQSTHISLTKVASGLGKMFPSCRPK